MSGPDRDQEMRRMARQVLSELVPGILREVVSEPGHGANGNGAAHGNGNGNGAHRARTPILDQRPDPVPQVPAPPIAAVLRPSTWNRPAAPGEIIGQPGPGSAAPAPARAGARRSPTPPLRAAAPSAPTTASSAPPPPSQPEHPPAPAPSAPTTVANAGADARVEVVTIDSDDDLMQFVRHLISRIANPRDRFAIHTGKLRFTLRNRPALAPAGTSAPSGPVTRIEKGAVTERVIRDAANAGTRLVLAPGAVLTPLARERAQALGVEIEQERKR